MARGAVVIIEKGNVALIKRHVGSRVYYLFPGGTIESGETAVEAAIRETREELGVEVTTHKLLATVQFKENIQSYFLATIVGGTFGTGTDPELQSPIDSEQGSYTPIWFPLKDLKSCDIRPRRLANAIEKTAPFRIKPMQFVEG